MGLVKAEKILMDSDLVGGSGLRLGSDLSLGLLMAGLLAVRIPTDAEKVLS